MPQQQTPLVGIIANPASGRDIRRLTAKASVFPTVEKANMIQRVLGALGATGIERVLMMPDMTGIAASVQRAIVAHRAEAHIHWPDVEFVDMDISESVDDTFNAVELMCRRGVAAIVVLGGDGTHRAVAMRCGNTPIATLSTGTNNAFPDLREATTAGFAAGLVASGRVAARDATRANKRLLVEAPGRHEVALVDVCVTRHLHVASRALWEADSLDELFVAFAEADSVGMSSIAGLLQPVPRSAPHGLHVKFADAGRPAVRRITAPIAPGLLARIQVAAFARIPAGETLAVSGGSGTVALDGEREIEFGSQDRLSVRLDLEGPRTIDVALTMGIAAQRGLLDI
ncbi:MAG: NAD(+)/NADH kinase [Sterolibacteriaceae bacterium]|nr:NAD(+)/NADH kinase [Sterolibacteriaceae bacterium]MBK9086139.1 NAD(+)/NADH kinase [Sterolibacteriaceae bacterium]